MAFVDKVTDRWYINDRDEQVFIGLTLPIILDNGQEASTKTTLEAVKVNVLNILNTEKGERVFQPNLGCRLKRFLFEPYSEEMIAQIQDVIIESLNYWLPFVLIRYIDVKMSDNFTGDGYSTLKISVGFSLELDPETQDSIELTIEGGGE